MFSRYSFPGKLNVIESRGTYTKRGIILTIRPCTLEQDSKFFLVVFIDEVRNLSIYFFRETPSPHDIYRETDWIKQTELWEQSIPDERNDFHRITTWRTYTYFLVSFSQRRVRFSDEIKFVRSSQESDFGSYNRWCRKW